MLGDTISFVSGMALLFLGSCVLWAYRPKLWPNNDATLVLQAAIFLGFVAAVGNTLFWQVLGQPLVKYDLVSVSTLRGIGDYLDLVFKGGAAFAAYLHLKALHLSLSENQRKVWRVLEMPFYRNRKGDDNDAV